MNEFWQIKFEVSFYLNDFVFGKLFILKGFQWQELKSISIIFGMRKSKQDSAEFQLVHQQTTIPLNHNKMLIANTCELDQLPFLKKPHYNWVPDEEEGEKSKIRLLQNLRSISYQCSDLMSKIFALNASVKRHTSTNYQNQQQSSEQPLIQELIVTTQKEIFTLQKFFYLINEILPQQQFSLMVSEIKRFVSKTKDYITDLVCSKYEINFKNKEFLTFGIYLHKGSPNSLDFKKQQDQDILKEFMQKSKFYIKCAITNFNFEPLRDIAELKTQKPQAFTIKSQLIVKRLFKIYMQLTQTYLPIRPKDIKQYIQNFERFSHFYDEEYLGFQVLKNFPLLRSKFYLPVIFKDRLTNQRLDGPIFSNSDPDCMFGHFIGYNADRIKELEGNHCQQCRSYIEGVQQNPIMTRLRDNPYNPYKTDVLFIPEFNRFKLILKTQVQKSQNQEQEEESPKFKTQIKYLNYLHFRSNLKKITTKKRNKFNDMLEIQRFPLTFSLWGRKILIIDPARGKNCSHYEFTDLRCYYLNKITQSTFKCPICQDIMSDNDILYLKQAQILMKYLKFKCLKFKQLVTTGFCYVNHMESKVFIEYKRKNKENKDLIETDILQIKSYYQHFVDPYVSFNQYALGMPDKYQQKLKEMYLFGHDKNNEEKDSDDDFEYKDLQPEEINAHKSFKTNVNSQNKLD